MPFLHSTSTTWSSCRRSFQACVEANSPVILQVSTGARKYANQTLLRYMAQGAVEYAKELNGGKGIPITLHLDHGNSFETVQELHRHGLLVGDDRRFVSSPTMRT